MGSQRIRNNWTTTILKVKEYHRACKKQNKTVPLSCHSYADSSSQERGSHPNPWNPWQCYFTWQSSVTQSCPTLCDPKDCSTPGFPVHHQLAELSQTHVHRIRDAIQPSHPLILSSSCLQSFPASVFSNELALCVRWPKYWSFSFSISSSNEYSGLISFRIDWLDLLPVQGTLKESSPAPQFINGCYYKKTRNQELYSFHW